MGGYTKELADGRVCYSASSIGYCSAALYRDRLGVTHEPPPENIRRAWAEGNDNESRIIELLQSQKVWKALDFERLHKAGFGFGEYDSDRGQDYSRQVRVERSIGERIVVRAHLDGIGEMVAVPPLWKDFMSVGDLAIIEAKAFGDSYWETWMRNREDKTLSAFPNYAWQVSVQMIASGLPCVFVVGKKDKSRGEVVVAFVIAREGQTVEPGALRDFARDQGLAQWKCPREVRVVTDLPRSPTGKVLKRVLVEQLSQES